MSIKPWLKWYPADWRSEPRLRIVPRAARSFWLDLIGLMHEANPYGHLIVAGRSPSPKELGAVLGDPERDVKRYLGELESAGIYSATAEGTIYSRRMVRDFAKAESDRKNGKGGGNPDLLNVDNGGDNPPENDEDKAQKPEARKPMQEDRTPKAPKGASYSEKFESAWKNYPRTPNMSKSDGFKAWGQVGAEAIDERQMLLAISRYKIFLSSETARTKRPHPVKHFAGWFRERRWEPYLEQASGAMPAQVTPDWADHVPQWAAFKIKQKPALWNAWLKPSVMGREPHELVVNSPFIASQIETLFGPALEAHFGKPVRIEVRQ